MAKRLIRLELSDAEIAWLDRQIAAGAFASRGEAVNQLLRRARIESTPSAVEREIRRGLASGPAQPLTPAVREDILRSARSAARKPTRRKSA